MKAFATGYALTYVSTLKLRFQQFLYSYVRIRCQGDLFSDRYLATAVSSGSTIPVSHLPCHSMSLDTSRS
jgi:hypothetical protein